MLENLHGRFVALRIGLGLENVARAQVYWRLLHRALRSCGSKHDRQALLCTVNFVIAYADRFCFNWVKACGLMLITRYRDKRWPVSLSGLF